MDFEQLKTDSKLYLLNEVDKISNNKLKNMCVQVLSTKVFLECVGSKDHHHAFHGGLLVHTSEVMQAASALINLPYSTKVDYDVVVTSVVYHDIGKIYDYAYTNYMNNGLCSDIAYTEHRNLIGHIQASHAIFVHNYSNEAKDTITPEEYEQVKKIQHSILSHHGRIEWGSIIAPQIPEAFILHLADMYSAKNTIFIKKS